MLGWSSNYWVTVITYIRPTLHYIFILFKLQQTVTKCIYNNEQDSNAV